MPRGVYRRGLYERCSRRRSGGAGWRLPCRRPAHAAGPPSPLDPQNWSCAGQPDLERLPRRCPGPDYSDPSIAPSVKKWKVALVVTDFPDKTFTISQPVGGTIFGTPTAEAHNIPRADVPAFYRDFLNKPQAINHFQTMNRYWMEDTHGKYGVQLDAFGPYQLPGRSYQYFMQRLRRRGEPHGALPGRRAVTRATRTSAPTPRRPGRPTSARTSSPPTTTSSTSPPARTSPPPGRSSAR